MSSKSPPTLVLDMQPQQSSLDLWEEMCTPGKGAALPTHSTSLPLLLQKGPEGARRQSPFLSVCVDQDGAH